MVDKARKELAPYQFLIAFPQIVSRIVLSNENAASVLMKIMALVIQKYPQQALWPTLGLMQSNRPERHDACNSVLQRSYQVSTNTNGFC